MEGKCRVRCSSAILGSQILQKPGYDVQHISALEF